MATSLKKKKKPECKYGSKCYRKNPKHFEEYSHGSDDDDLVKEEKKGEDGPSKKRPKLDDSIRNTNDIANKAACKETGLSDDDSQSPLSVPSCSTSGGTEEHASSLTDELRADSPDDPRENIKCKFLVEMPKDFYGFWDFAKSLNAKCPSAAFAASLDLHLVGPYDVLAGKTDRKNGKRKPNYLRHWRYYYDPPEMLTVVRGDDQSQFHLGYYRDDPKEMPAFVVSNAAAENSVLKPLGENIFAAFNSLMEERLKKTADKSVLELQKKLKSWAAARKFSLEKTTAKMKARDKKAVCKCFHGVGVVVPVDKNGIGYRPLPESHSSFKNLLKKIKDSTTEEEHTVNFDRVMELMMCVQFANDESDYGEGLEMGLNIFSYGGEVFHKFILNLLPLAYQLLGRNEYAEVIKVHLEKRRHSAKLSELD